MIYDVEEVTCMTPHRLIDFQAKHAETWSQLQRQKELLNGLQEAVNSLSTSRDPTGSSGVGGGNGDLCYIYFIF